MKVIDFGVAKAVGQTLTDKTIYTRLAQMVGTPLYMSPEQAEVNQLDVDTLHKSRLLKRLRTQQLNLMMP